MIYPSLRGLWHSVVGRSKPLTKSEFTEYAAWMLSRKYGRLHVRVVEDLVIEIVPPDSEGNELYLDNAYANYLLVPEALDDIMVPILELKPSLTAEELEQPSVLARVIPVIRPRQFLDNCENYHKTPTNVPYADPFCADLHTLYVVDDPNQMAFITRGQVAAISITLDELRQTAMANLYRMIPQIEAHPLRGSYMLEADGNYESSLLLLDNIWSGDLYNFVGDLVVAVPARGLVFVTEATNAEGMEFLREQARSYCKVGHAISPHLFTRRKDRWELLE